MSNVGKKGIAVIRPLSRVDLCGLFVLASILTACGGGGGGSVTQTAPVAASGVLSTDEDTAANSTLSASDANGDSLTYSIVSNAGKGAATLTNLATGAYTYTPNPDADGADSFTFKANDGTENSNVATVTVTINPVNDAPVAAAGVLETDEDTPNSGTLSASDAEGDRLTYIIVSNAGKGTATVTDPATGAYTYTPDPGADGADSFTFKSNDGTDDSNEATVSVTINPVNNPPVATGGCSTTPQEQNLLGTLAATDLETPSLLMYSLNADGSGGLGPITTANGGGTITITDATTGAYTYQPASLPATSGGRGTDSFDFQVSDPDGESDSATETVIVNQKIMPLGDSITEGVTTPTPADLVADLVGYRLPLSDLLTTAGFTFDFVGSESHGTGFPDFDVNHEGHPAWTASEIAFGRLGDGGVLAWLDANPADIVLLHAGTNELASTTEFDIADILTEIDNWEASPVGNHVTVLLALIIDQDPINPLVIPFNDAVRTMANIRINFLDDDIIIVNQHDALSYPADLSDPLHPNETGYGKMARTWFSDPLDEPRLDTLLDTCP